nr:sushi, nidogen and EGF-like domain-containing protein 1 [Lytechinus pictus]
MPGWEGDDCSVAINACDPDPCFNGATCNDLQSSFTCTCPDGFGGTVVRQSLWHVLATHVRTVQHVLLVANQMKASSVYVKLDGKESRANWPQMHVHPHHV